MRATLLLGLLGCSVKVATGDTSETGDPPVEDSTACGAWTGFREEGQTWSYAWVSGDTSGDGLMTLDDLDELGGAAQTSLVLSFSGPELSSTITTTVSYICDPEGIWVGTQSTDWETVSGDYTSASWLLSSYDPPWLMLARLAADGDTWTGSTSHEQQGSAVETTVADKTWSMTAATETVTVPAGTYEALRVDVTGDLGVTSWYADGVGLVKTGDLQLIATGP